MTDFVAVHPSLLIIDNCTIVYGVYNNYNYYIILHRMFCPALRGRQRPLGRRRLSGGELQRRRHADVEERSDASCDGQSKKTDANGGIPHFTHRQVLSPVVSRIKCTAAIPCNLNASFNEYFRVRTVRLFFRPEAYNMRR